MIVQESLGELIELPVVHPEQEKWKDECKKWRNTQYKLTTVISPFFKGWLISSSLSKYFSASENIRTGLLIAISLTFLYQLGGNTPNKRYMMVTVYTITIYLPFSESLNPNRIQYNQKSLNSFNNFGDGDMIGFI